ncbi:MAG TPA: hypothetical protein V6C65_38340 [Allocoleopsis sp.]
MSSIYLRHSLSPFGATSPRNFTQTEKFLLEPVADFLDLAHN